MKNYLDEHQASWERYERLLLNLSTVELDKLRMHLTEVLPQEDGQRVLGLVRYQIDAEGQLNSPEDVNGEALEAFLLNADPALVALLSHGCVYLRLAPAQNVGEGTLFSCGLDTFETWLNQISIGPKLTNAEKRLAIQLLCGQDLADAAKMDGVSYETKRAHLKAVTSKLGVSKQKEVISALLVPIFGKLLYEPSQDNDYEILVDFLGRFSASSVRMARVVDKQNRIHRMVEFGSSNGKPIIVLHSPIVIVPDTKAIEALCRRGLRLICPLRPGAISDAQASRSFDVHLHAVLDGIEACVDLSCPNGAHILSMLNADYYAVQFAMRTPEKVKSLNIVASVRRRRVEGRSKMRHHLTKFAFRDPTIFRLILKSIMLRCRTKEQLEGVMHFAYPKGTADRKLIEGLATPSKSQAIFEAARQSMSSITHDLYTWALPFDQHLASADVPMTFFHGDKEYYHPIEELTANLRRAGKSPAINLPGCGQVVDGEHLVGLIGRLASIIDHQQ